MQFMNYLYKSKITNMTISDDLFQLIKSLKQTEKRYFKLYASLHSKRNTNNYVKLFNAIDSQKTYNEKAILQKFNNEAFIKQFSVTKNYLYQIILKSLRAYSTTNSADARINEQVESARILYGKGLYKKSFQLLKKAKKLAYAYQKHEQLLIILNLEREITRRYSVDNKANTNENKGFRYEYVNIVNIIKNKYEMQLLTHDAFDLYYNYMIARSKEELEIYKKIINEPLLQDINKALSLKAKDGFYKIYSTYYAVQENYKKLYDSTIFQVQIIEANPAYKEDNLLPYIVSLNNLLEAQLKLEYYTEFQATLKKMRNIPQQFANKITTTEKAVIFETSYQLELNYYFNELLFAEGIALVPEVNAGLEQFEGALLTVSKLDILFIISKLYFYSGHHKEALNWVSKIVLEDKSSPADDILCFARLLNILIHYELQNFDLLHYEIKSTRRFLVKKKRLYKVENLILRYLRKLINAPYNDKKLFQKFKADLLLLLAQPFEQSSSAYLNLIHWINSKLQKTPIRKVMLAAKKQKVAELNQTITN